MGRRETGARFALLPVFLRLRFLMRATPFVFEATLAPTGVVSRLCIAVHAGDTHVHCVVLRDQDLNGGSFLGRRRPFLHELEQLVVV